MYIISLDTQTISLEAGVLVPNLEMRKVKLSDSCNIIEAESEEQKSNKPSGLLMIHLLPQNNKSLHMASSHQPR